MNDIPLKSKIIVLICFFISLLTSCGQTKDKRAEIELQGRINKISLSPDNTIWLTSYLGQTYFSTDLGTNWHHGKSVYKQKDEFAFFAPQLEQISFFNKDIAIMTGYISTDENSEKNQYYLTNDGGKNWKLHQLNHNARVNCAFTNPEGKAWLGCDEMAICYSNNYGQKFTKITLPLQKSERVLDIYMSNLINGILCTDREILKTNDNWKTAKSILSPLDQKKIISTDEENNKISKIGIWNNYLVIKQNEKIFYTDIQNIDWKPFPINDLVYFEINQQSNQLFVVNKKGDFFKLTSPQNYEVFAQNKDIALVLDIKFINDSLLVLANFNQLYKINKTSNEEIIPYTTDYKIKKPFIIKKSENVTIGCQGKHLYILDDNNEWYREKIFDFYIHNVRFLDEKTILLWNEAQQTHSYSFEDKLVKPYEHHLPFKTFFESPIESLVIESGNSGCFHHSSNKIIYKNIDNSFLETTKMIIEKGLEKNKFENFNQKFKTEQLTNILNAINAAPNKIPSINNFNITEKDKKNYLIAVDSLIKKPKTDYRGNEKRIDKDFYYSIVNKLDTISPVTIEKILKKKEQIISTSSSHFSIKIINQKKDTILISRFYFEKSHGWHLPWEIEYKGQHFECFNIDFSRFIKECLPKNFNNTEEFDNSVLIMEIADYFYFKDEEKN